MPSGLQPDPVSHLGTRRDERRDRHGVPCHVRSRLYTTTPAYDLDRDRAWWTERDSNSHLTSCKDAALPLCYRPVTPVPTRTHEYAPMRPRRETPPPLRSDGGVVLTEGIEPPTNRSSSDRSTDELSKHGCGREIRTPDQGV